VTLPGNLRPERLSFEASEGHPFGDERAAPAVVTLIPEE
jgi:hypothetical protein